MTNPDASDRSATEGHTPTVQAVRTARTPTADAAAATPRSTADPGDEIAHGIAAAIREAAPPDVATFRRWLLAGKEAESD